MTEPWCCERDARGVVTLTLNRPQPFNALSEAMLTALQAELDAVAHDEQRARCRDRRRGQGVLRGPRPEGDARRASLAYYQRLFAQCAQ